MRTIHAPKTRLQLRYRRHLRVRRKVSGTAERPRLVVYRSLTAPPRLAVPRVPASSWLKRPRPPALPKSCSTGQVTVTMVVCRPSRTAHAKVDWSSNGR
jgi:hypothetical protein